MLVFSFALSLTFLERVNLHPSKVSTCKQHAALVAAQGRLQQDERIFAFLDDIYTTSSPDRVGAVYAILQEELCKPLWHSDPH